MYKFRKLSIRYQLFVFIVLSIISTLSVFLLMNYQMSKVIFNKNTQYTNEVIMQVKQRINENCEQLNRIINNIAYNEGVQEFLLEENEEKLFSKTLNTHKLLINMQELKEGIKDIVILGKNGNFLSRYGSANCIAKGFDTPLKNENIAYSSYLDYLNENLNNCFLIYSKVNSINPTKKYGEEIGNVIIVIDKKVFEADVKVISKLQDTEFYLLDKENKVYSSSTKKYINENFDAVHVSPIKEGETVIQYRNKQKCFVRVDNIPYIQGKIVSIVPEKALFSDFIKTRRNSILIFAAVLAVVCVCFKLILNNIMIPINKFLEFFSKIKMEEKEGIKDRLYIDSFKEMELMVNKFNKMLDRVNLLTNTILETNSKLYQSEIEKKQSELAFLQSQINPHFLYNTLESIRCIAVVKGVDEIRDMTKSLAQIMRYSIKGKDEVKFLEEIKIVQAYIKIQQIRFKDKFSVKCDFSEDTEGCIVPKMIIQPIVENSIYHGLEVKIDKGELLISSFIEGEDLVIKVADDGVGMDKECLEELRGKLVLSYTSGTKKAKASVGLSNVNNRIKFNYGEEYGISVSSELNFGTEVVIRIPARRG